MKKDYLYLRDLAKRYSEYCSEEKWKEIRELWIAKNSLKKVRPLVLCTIPVEAWEELIPTNSCVVDDDFLKKYEIILKRQIYRAEHLHDDEVLEPVLYSPLEYTFSDWIENRERPYSKNYAKSAECFHPVIIETSDLKKLKQPKLLEIKDREADRKYDLLNEIFGDILEVKKGYPYSSDSDSYIKGWGFSVIDVWCELRGLENVYYDMALQPDFTHEAMEFLTQGIENYKKEMYNNGLLRLNNMAFVSSANTPLGSNGLSITDELPTENFDGKVRYKDIWGYSMAQELSEVSPEMHAEFVLPYQKRLVHDFGLLSYGCCESNDKKWENIIETFDNLREVSVSHVANVKLASEKLRDKYVLSWKPNCSVIATYDEEIITKQLRKGYEDAKNSHLICCLRDNITLFGAPERLEGWINIAKVLAAEYE